ncbi:MAG: 5-formyltetrahydrofolate cyclo-ligase [Caldicoprobacterales bacterium]
MENIIKEKAKLRVKMKESRNQLTDQDVLDKSKRIQNLLNSILAKSCYNNYMSYVSIKNEVRTIEIIDNLLKNGNNVSVPVCITETTKLIASQIFHIDELVPTHFGLLEPKSDSIRPVEPECLDLVLVPGLAFDRKGNRLGYGKGYYDGFLTKVSSNTLKIGLAYSFQIINEVPVDSSDVPLDIIVTDKEIITC